MENLIEKKAIGSLLAQKNVTKDSQELLIATASAMIKAYKEDTSPQKPVFIDERTLEPVKAFCIDAAALDKIRSLDGYSGIRIYFAIRNYTIDNKPVYTLVIVPKGPEHANGKSKNISR